MLCDLGNALQTVKSLDTVKLLTVRSTAFEAAGSSGGTAATEAGYNFSCIYQDEMYTTLMCSGMLTYSTGMAYSD